MKREPCIVMTQGPGIVVPLVCTLVLNVFPLSRQSITIEFSIHCLCWWNKFLMHDAFVVKKQTKIFSLFLELSADSNVVFLLIVAQQPWHKFCCSAPHIELIRQNLLACSI